MARAKRDAPVLLLGAALIAAAIALVLAEWDVTFFQDTWSFLLDRQDTNADAFLLPHNEHIVIVPVAITKLLLAVFGMTSNTPEQVAMGASVLGVGALVFVYARRRLDPWLALIAACLLLFLGSGWWTTIWPFENEFTLPLLFGLGALLMLERRDTRGDLLACGLLALAVASGSLGMCFVAAAWVDWLLGLRERGWRRGYVFVVPVLLYLAWYAGWGNKAEHHLTGENILTAPAYVFEGIATSLSSITGLSGVPDAAASAANWGPALLIGAIALVVIAQLRRPGFSRGFWVVGAAGLTYWLLAALNYIPGREPSQLRYVYAGAVFTLLIAIELLRGWQPNRRALIAIGAGAALAIGPNLATLKEGSDFLQEQSVLTRADLAALEIARDTVRPDFGLSDDEVVGTETLSPVTAGRYFEAADRWGSPAYDLAELEAAPENGRHWADVVLSEALPIGHETVAGFASAKPAGKRCLTIAPGEAPGKQFELAPGTTTMEVAPGAPAALSLRRFAQAEFPVSLATVEGGTTTTVRIPRDRAPTRWYGYLEAAQLTRVCH